MFQRLREKDKNNRSESSITRQPRVGCFSYRLGYSARGNMWRFMYLPTVYWEYLGGSLTTQLISIVVAIMYTHTYCLDIKNVLKPIFSVNVTDLLQPNIQHSSWFIVYIISNIFNTSIHFWTWTMDLSYNRSDINALPN